MPLVHSKSKKAFKENVRTEMEANPDKKDRAQNLAIAYSVQRQAKKKHKKMAEGGETGINKENYPKDEHQNRGVSKAGSIVRDITHNTHYDEEGERSALRRAKETHKKTLNDMRSMQNPKLQGLAEGGEISAKTEKRPSTQELYDDEHDVHEQNREKQSIMSAADESRPSPEYRSGKQGAGMKISRKKHPDMVKSDVIQVRLRDDEDDLQRSAGTNEGPQHQPPEIDNEVDPKKRGKSPEKQTAISTGRQVMAKGGKVESSDYDDTDPNAVSDGEDQDHTDSSMHETPSMDEGDDMARHHEEEYQRQTSGDPDYSEPHSDDIDTYKYAEGGFAEHTEDGQPEPEQEDEEHDSIAAAVMARRERAKAEIESGAHDMNLAARYAEGGEITHERGPILSEGAMDSDDSSEVNLRRNAEESQNQEDQASFHALEKENYSESEGLDDLDYDTSRSTGDEREDERSDAHDMVDSIRRKMRQKRFSET